MVDTLQEYRNNLQIQNLQQQVKDNNEAARKFRQAQQDISGFPVAAQKGPAFDRLVNRLGQQRAPEQIAQQNQAVNAQLASLGASTIASDFDIDQNRRFSPSFSVNQSGQQIPIPSGPDGRALPPSQIFSRDGSPQIQSQFANPQTQGGFANGQYFANPSDFVDNVPSTPPQGVTPPEGQGQIGTAVSFQRGPNGEVIQTNGAQGGQAQVTTPTPQGGVQQTTVTAEPGTIQGAQVTTQQTEVQPTQGGGTILTNDQIARFQGTDDANRERITGAYSNLSNLLNENNSQFLSLVNLVDRDEKNRLLGDQQYYTSVYGPGGEMERLNNEFYTGLQNFMAKQGSERTALATALATRPGSTPSQVQAQIAQQEAQQLGEILKVKQQQIGDIDRVRRTFVDLEQRFRQEHANSTDKNIVNTYREIKNQKDQIATAYTEAVRQYDQQLQTLNTAASGGTTQSTPAEVGRFLTATEVEQLSPTERELYLNQLRQLQTNAESFNQ